MNRLRVLGQSFGLLLLSSLLVSCGALAAYMPEPTATPEIPRRANDVPRIAPEELKARLDNGEEILIVDSRALSLFEIEHIAGAISVPKHEVDERLDEFPRDQEIVFY